MDCFDGKRVISPTLVGRAEELERLASAVIAPPAVVVLEGEAGIGKTRLVTELAAHADAGDRRFMVGSCRPIREPFPLGPLVEAMRGLGGALDGAALSPVAGALRPLLPEIAHALPAAPEPLDDRAMERHRVFRGLVEVLGSLDAAILVLEDLHWADEQTIDFLGYLLGRPPSALSVLLTFRTEEVDPAVRSLTATLPAGVSTSHVNLAALDEGQTRALAASLLGETRISTEFGAHLHERTAGLPFAIEEVLALLQARGSLRRRGGSWARKTLDQLDVPAGIRDPILERVSRLSSSARAVVAVAAVLQKPMSMEVLTATCQMPSTHARAGVEEALDSVVLVESADGIGFRHLLAAQAVYEATPRTHRQDLHARAAAVLEAVHPIPFGHIAHHLRHAGRLEAWVDATDRAVDQAVELGHIDEAARLLEDVLRHAPLNAERRGQIAVTLGRTALDTVRPTGVTGLLSEVLENDLPPPVGGELRLRLALLLEQSGADPTRQRRLFAEAVQELDDRPDLKAWAMVGLGLGAAVAGIPRSERTMWLDRALGILPTVSDPAFGTFLLAKVAMWRTVEGDRTWRRLSDQMVEQTAGSPRQRPEVRAYESVALAACYVGHHQTADMLLTAAFEGAVALDSAYLQRRNQSVRVLLEWCCGRWESLDEAVEILIDELADHAPCRRDVEMVAGCLALARGELDGAQQRLTDVVRQVDGPAGFELLPLAAPALVRLALARREIDKAEPSIASLVDALERSGLRAVVARGLPAATEGLVAGGQMAEARELVMRYGAELRELDAPLAPAAWHHAQGVLAAATESWPTAARRFLKAADLYESLRCPYEGAQAHEQAAVCLFATGDASASASLQAALGTYQRLGATWDLDRASSVARDHGVPVRARHRGGRRGYGSDLSPRQREVAELAATGRTNREIALALYLSPKTVDNHLSAALRKLGLHSRMALAHHLRKDGQDGRTNNEVFSS